MSIQGLWGSLPYAEYSFDSKGAKGRSENGHVKFEVNARDETGKTSPAKSAGADIVSSHTVNNAATASTLWQTQNFAQSPESDAIEAEEVKMPVKSTAEQFLEHMNKSPEELMREEILKSLGYTEEELAAMDPKERAAVEAKIQELIEIKIEEAMREDGVNIDSAKNVELQTSIISAA